MKATREITEIKSGINRIKFKIAVTTEGGTHTLYLGLETLVEQVINGVEFEVNNEELAETINELVLSQLTVEEDETIDGEVVYDVYECKVYIEDEIVEVDYDNFVKTYKRGKMAEKYATKNNREMQKSFVSHLELVQ